jgi:large subunit ribosomal protein L13
MRVKNPNYILEHAVAGMLPKNKLRPGMIARLKLESTSQHQYAAQKPEPLALV